VFSFFKRKRLPQNPPLTTDLHSHLLPGLDDGVASFEQAKEIILHFQRLGYSKLITTPHVMSDAYRNTSEGILARLEELKKYLAEQGISMAMEAAAEYYLDEQCMANVANNSPMLTFGDRYLLFETNFLTEPFNLKEFIFQAITKGYRPVLAHPERYIYIHHDLKKAEELLDRGVLFQVNISSLTGYYSREAQSTAQKLIDRGWIHFLGSDCHHAQHVVLLEQAQNMKYYQKALSLTLLNNTL
jgi:tyrosine-protein phosphatase YwqE